MNMDITRSDMGSADFDKKFERKDRQKLLLLRINCYQSTDALSLTSPTDPQLLVHLRCQECVCEDDFQNMQMSDDSLSRSPWRCSLPVM